MNNNELKIFIEYDPPNWNEYINAERTNFYKANKIKQKEKMLIKLLVKEKYKGAYPVELIVKPHFKDHRRDLDNTRIKGLIDGLVSTGTLKNDNLTYIQRIVLEPVFDDKIGIEMEIREWKKQ